MKVMIMSLKAMGCSMSLKVHLLYSYLDFFPEDLRAVSDEHEERFREDITKFGKNIQGSGMQACWRSTGGFWD